MSTESKLERREGRVAEKLHQRPQIAPLVDIYENKEEILIVADLPGVTQDGLAIHLEKGELAFEARRADAADIGPGTDVAGLPDYRRSFVLPQGIEIDKIAADLKEGLLKIHLPKTAALKPRQIPIRTS
jgi:HSP20 family molecular chaperone IbpA